MQLGLNEKELGYHLKINILMQNDMFFKTSLEQLKLEHKNIDFSRNEDNENLSYAATHMVNQAIIKELRADK